MASAFSCPGFMAILYWLACGSNPKKLNRKNTNGNSIIAMVRKLKKTINLPDFLIVYSALLSEIIDRLAYHWNKSQLLFVLFVLGLSFRSVSKAES